MGSTGCVTWVGRAWNKERSLKTVSLQVLGLLYLNSPPENQGQSLVQHKTWLSRHRELTHQSIKTTSDNSCGLGDVPCRRQR